MSWGALESFSIKSFTKSARNTTENELEAPELFISKSVTVSTNTQPGNAPESSGTQIFENTREFQKKTKKTRFVNLPSQGTHLKTLRPKSLKTLGNFKKKQKKQDLQTYPARGGTRKLWDPNL